jgi:hypothetical protein
MSVEYGWNENWQGKPKYSEILQILTWDLTIVPANRKLGFNCVSQVQGQISDG